VADANITPDEYREMEICDIVKLFDAVNERIKQQQKEIEKSKNK